MNLLGVLEGILFVVGDEGISLKAICNTLDINEDKAKELLKEIKEEYEKEHHGLRVSYLGDAFKLTTKKEHKEYYQNLIETGETNTLSNAALETLAIIAYNGPLTRAEVDELRGVSTSHIIRKLIAKELIKETGKSEMPGRPNLYAVTKEFLDYFGLATINDLPKLENSFNEIEDTELFNSIYKEKVEI